MSGWTPPPQQPGYGGPQPPQQPQQPYGQQPYGQQPPPYQQTPPPFGQPGPGTPPPFGQPAYAQGGFPPPQGGGQKSGGGAKVALLVVGGLVVVAIIAAVALFALADGDGGLGGDDYVLSAPATAGGYPKVTDAASDPFGSSFRGILGNKGTVVSATYDANGTKVIFTGVSGQDLGDQSAFETGLKSVGANVTVHPTSSGGSGTAKCAEITVATFTQPFCWWQTDTSFGMVYGVADASSLGSGGVTWTKLADIMRKIRPDVEKPA